MWWVTCQEGKQDSCLLRKWPPSLSPFSHQCILKFIQKNVIYFLLKTQLIKLIVDCHSLFLRLCLAGLPLKILWRVISSSKSKCSSLRCKQMVKKISYYWKAPIVVPKETQFSKFAYQKEVLWMWRIIVWISLVIQIERKLCHLSDDFLVAEMEFDPGVAHFILVNAIFAQMRRHIGPTVFAEYLWTQPNHSLSIFRGHL